MLTMALTAFAVASWRLREAPLCQEYRLEAHDLSYYKLHIHLLITYTQFTPETSKRNYER